MKGKRTAGKRTVTSILTAFMIDLFGGSSLIFISLYFLPYPIFSGELQILCLALFFLGAAVQFFLLCKTKRARLFPVLCLAAEIILEALCQLDRFNILHIINGHDFF